MHPGNEQPCPCNSGAHFDSCCHPYLNGAQSPLTATALMRSRFSAYRLQQYDYLMLTWDPVSAPPSAEALAESCHDTRWIGLQVHNSERGEAGDNEGRVSFSAWFREQGGHGKLQALHEHSLFLRDQRGWRYVQGGALHTPPLPGRNSPCICGSGRKFKQCCLD